MNHIGPASFLDATPVPATPAAAPPTRIAGQPLRRVFRDETAAEPVLATALQRKIADPAYFDIPPVEMARVLDAPPDMSERGSKDVCPTRRWRHGPLHDSLIPMRGHTIMTFYAHPQAVSWRSGRERLTGRTQPGTITIIPDGVGGRLDIEGPIEVSHLYLSAERLQAGAAELTGGRDVDLLSRVGFEDPSAAHILEMIAREAEADDPSTRLFGEQAVNLLVTQLVRAHSSAGAAAPSAPRRGLADWQVRRVVEYMRENLDDSVGLDELAGVVGLSRFHFLTSFRLATGKTPHDWLVGERIERARTLLAEEPDTSVTEVAMAVGYGTPSAFSASFRRVAGMTPSEFRRRL